MITARIHLDSDDEHGIVAQLMCIPRIGETISIPDTDGEERDLKIIGLNHWVKPIAGQVTQVEIVIFCQPTITFT